MQDLALYLMKSLQAETCLHVNELDAQTVAAIKLACRVREAQVAGLKLRYNSAIFSPSS